MQNTSTAQVPSKRAPLLPRHSVHPPKGKFGNWQFRLALKSQWITGQGGVGWIKPSLDFHVWWPKFKVLLGVSAKKASHPILLFLGKSSGVCFNNGKDLFPASALKGSCDYVRIHSSISKSATHFYFKNTALYVLCLLAGPWGRYMGAGTTCFLLRSQQLGKKKQMEMMWNDSRLIRNWRKSKHCRHEAFWAMKKKPWKEMRGSLVCWSDSPISTHLFFHVDITVREQSLKNGRYDEVPSDSTYYLSQTSVQSQLRHMIGDLNTTSSRNNEETQDIWPKQETTSE